jgi:Caspase domain
MSPRPTEFSKSRAILLGTSEHATGSGLTAMPAALRSLDAMGDLLTSPACGWPAGRVSRLVNKSTQDGVAGEIASLISEATDVLLFYYVGHGQLLRGGDDLGMALTDTSNRVELRRATSLRLSDLREDLKYSRCRIKIVILDCCFSGIATRNTQSPGDLADRIDRAARVSGSFTLTASRANQAAIYEDGKGGLTYFTKVLAETIGEGIPGVGPDLTLADIHQELERRFAGLDITDELERPEPTRLSSDSADRFNFARNVAPEASRAPRSAPAQNSPTPAAPTAAPSPSPAGGSPPADTLARLRRRAWKLTGGALATGAVIGAEYTHHHDAQPSPAGHPAVSDGSHADPPWGAASPWGHGAASAWQDNDGGDAAEQHDAHGHGSDAGNAYLDYGASAAGSSDDGG